MAFLISFNYFYIYYINNYNNNKYYVVLLVSSDKQNCNLTAQPSKSNQFDK